MYLMPAGATVRNRKLSGAPGGFGPIAPVAGGWGYRPPVLRPPIQPIAPALPAAAAPPTNQAPFQNDLIIAGRYNWWPPAPSTPATLPGGQAIPGSPVPVGYPTNQIFVDTSGNQWQFNVATGQWANIGNPNYSGASYYYPGTPVPQGYPTNQIFTDGAGNIWQFQSGTWVNTGTAASTTTSLFDTTGAPAPGTSVMTPAATSSYQSILDWLTQQTLIGGIPNWVLAAGIGFAALKLSGSQARGR